MIKPAIIIVDDFPQVLHKLRNDLEQKYSDHFRIIEARTGQQALDQLKQMSLHNEPVALLLIDEQMPEMTGSEFLKEVRDLYPQAKRILLITYADTHAAIQAIKDEQIDYYLMKPWDPPVFFSSQYKVYGTPVALSSIYVISSIIYMKQKIYFL